jgi:hypothetical protein
MKRPFAFPFYHEVHPIPTCQDIRSEHAGIVPPGHHRYIPAGGMFQGFYYPSCLVMHPGGVEGKSDEVGLWSGDNPVYRLLPAKAAEICVEKIAVPPGLYGCALQV